jgi:hypothetical protein
MDWWSTLAIAIPLVVVLVREFLALRKDADRRDSIERLVAIAPSGLHITDRTSDGGVIEIVVNKVESTGLTVEGQDPSAS